MEAEKSINIVAEINNNRNFKSFFYRDPRMILLTKGVYMGMGNHMGKVEIDDRGRLTLPSKIREKLFIKSGDKLSIKVNKDNSILLRKSPTKDQIFKHLVGCITTPAEEKVTPEMIKSIWKQNP